MPDKIAQLLAEIAELKERMKNSSLSHEQLAQMQIWLREKETDAERLITAENSPANNS